MKQEEAIERIKARFDKWALDNEDMKAIQTLIPELRENEDERIRKALIEGVRQIRCKNGITQEQMVAYLEKQKETGIQWFKSDNVKNPDKPYIDKAGMFYTTDGRMCYASEIEKQKEQKPIKWTDLTWKDIVELEGIINNVHYDFSDGIGQESFGKEVLERFRSTKGIEYLDEAEQKYWREEGQKEQKLACEDNFKWTSQDERCRGKLIDILELADIKYPATKDSRDELWEWLKELPMKFPNKNAFVYGTLDSDDKWSQTEEILGVDGNPTCYKQKPADDKSFEEWIDDWWKYNKVNNPDSYNKGDEIQFDEQGFKRFCRGIRNMYQQKLVHTAKEMWKEMRLETYAQASGNRHEPNYSDDSTKMFSLCDIDEIFEKIDNSIVGYSPQMMYPKKYV